VGVAVVLVPLAVWELVQLTLQAPFACAEDKPASTHLGRLALLQLQRAL